MKKYLYFLLLVIIYTGIYTVSTFAQVGEDDEKIWSIVKLEPNNTRKVKSDYRWIPAEPVSIFYDLETGITVDPNFRPKPTSNSTQSEMSVDVHPSNPNIVFGSANATDWPVTQVYGTGVYWSLDGGVSWTGFDQPPFGSNRGDPVSVIGTDGRFYENYISNSSGQGVAVSTNNGTNWSTYTVAPNPGSLADKNHFMVDKKSGSPYENRTYCAFTDFGGSNDGDVVLRYSTNFGQTWNSSSINLSSSLSAFNQGVNIQTGPNGEVYATWAVYTGSFGYEDGIAFAKSTDGGVSWSAPTYAYYHQDFGIRGTLSSKNGIRVASFPSMAVDRNNGTIYITWPQRGVAPAGNDPDIVLIKSINGGTSWSSPVRVNDDALNNGQDQYYSWCTVDQSTGQLMLVFYDSRNVPNNQAEVFMARSLDGGNTFENFKVSDQPHTPSPISGLAGGYAGDYIGVAALDDIAYPFWADNRTSNYQGWMAVVTFGPPCPIGLPSDPNPSDETTNVSAYLSEISWTNGIDATQCEVWFGEAGNMSKVHDGSLISSWSIPSQLNYNTTYNWRIVDKDNNCSISGPIWAFSTELSPAIVFMETFENLSCWTPIGPLGTTNWSIQNSTIAGGTAPELKLSWTPQFDGLSKLVSCAIPVENNHDYSVNLKHMLDWYTNPAPNFGLGVSYDNGATYTSIWNLQPTGNVGPETITVPFTTPPTGDSPDATNLYLVLYCNGNSYNIDYWYVDDITLIDDEFSIVADPTFFTVTAISDSEIDISFTSNSSNDNVVITWNLTGTFTAPSGAPPAVGLPFAGGTLLYNGTTSPVIHGDLNGLTTYYYKAFSYDNVNYSPGIEVNATTLATQAAIDIPFLATDGSVPSPIEIAVGLDLTATDGIDEALGEAALPPLAPGLDVRFQVVGAQSYRDYRAPGDPPAFPFTGIIQHNIMLKAADPAFDISLEYDLPPGAAFRITDKVGGSFFNIGPFTGTGVAVIPASYLNVFTSAWFYMDYQVTFPLSVAVFNGWNMVSAPGLHPTDQNVETWWPNLTGTVWGFNGVQYVAHSIATPGEGYWMENTVAETYNYPAIGIVPHDPIPATVGWNMIGGYENSPLVGSLTTDPPGQLTTGIVWGYNGVQYVQVTNLVPGDGYWIEVDAVCNIIIPSGPLAKGSGEVVELFKEDWGRIILTDAEGKSYTLYAVKGEVDLDLYKMPPLPPAGSFDIRFSSGRIAEDINSSIQTIDMTGVTYPLTVRVEGMDIRLQDETGNQINENIKSGDEITISNTQINKLMVTGEMIPDVYALEQNYPNPFNPTTVIEFSLPEDVGNVKLSIYNTLGEKVAELVNTGLATGKYQYQWNAQNVATGMYIYELRTDKFVSVKKMILLK